MNADCRRVQVYLRKQVLSKPDAHLLQLLWHILLVFVFHKFLARQNQLFNYYICFPLSLKATQWGWSTFPFCLFAIWSTCQWKRDCSASSAEGQKYTTTFIDAEGQTLNVSIQGLHCGHCYIVLHGTWFPDSNINRFLFCVLFTMRRNLIFPNGPL